MSEDHSRPAVQNADGRLSALSMGDSTEDGNGSSSEPDRSLCILYRFIVETAGDGICCLDTEGRITFVNRTATELLGYGRNELVGTLNHDWVHRPRANGAPPAPEDCPICSAVQGRPGPRRGETFFRCKNGRPLLVEYQYRSVFRGGRLTGGVLVFRDVSWRKQMKKERARLLALVARGMTERKRMEEQVDYLTNHDVLTGLINRRRFQEGLRAEFDRAKLSGSSLALLFLDLDHFKDINDALGHQAGDEALMGVARILREVIGPSDLAARFGGDKFAILLPGVDVDEAQAIGERIIARLRQERFSVGSGTIELRGSVGIAVYPRHAAGVDDLLVTADLAMCAAKTRGRNCLTVYTKGDQGREKAGSRLVWEHRIRSALRRGDFALYWQPLLELRAGRVVGYELLLRMKGQDGEQVLPQQFLPVAERSDLVCLIDRWVVGRALALLEQASGSSDPPCMLHVNLSGRTASNEEAVQEIHALLERSAVDRSRLVLEITETAAVSDNEKARRCIESLRQTGVRIALDDFGVGFSSLAVLRNLPVDFLKIDGSFIHNLAEDPVNQHLVRVIVAAARGLGKQTIAEHVHDERTLALVAEYGVDYGQGYYIGQPRPCPVPPTERSSR